MRDPEDHFLSIQLENREETHFPILVIFEVYSLNNMITDNTETQEADSLPHLHKPPSYRKCMTALSMPS